MSRRLLIAVLLALAPAAGWAESIPNVLIVSDIHFNPFDDPAVAGTLAQAPAERWASILETDRALPISGLGDDSNYALLASMFASMKATLPKPSLVLVTGDFLAHSFHERFDRSTAASVTKYNDFVDKTLAFLALQFGATFPDAEIVPVVGNNDSWCGDYASAPHNGFLSHMATAWEPLANRNGSSPKFKKEFGAFGHAVVTVPGTHLELVVVNSVFWSRKFKPFKNKCGNSGSHPGEDEVRWLQKQLAHAQSPVWVVTHIPPGIDPFSTIAKIDPVLYYAEKPEKELLETLGRNAGKVRLVIAGHTHMAGFRLTDVIYPDKDVPILIAPGISPMFGNDPSYRVATTDFSTGTISDFADVELRQPAEGKGDRSWQVACKLSDLHMPEFSIRAITTLRRRMDEDTDQRSLLQSAYSSTPAVQSKLVNSWRTYVCSVDAMTTDAYDACIRH